MGALLDKLYSSFYGSKLEIVLVGIENAGKTTLLQRIAQENPVETGSTLGLSVKLMSRDGINIKAWDLGGGEQFRQEWARYCIGTDVILFAVDASDIANVSKAKIALHRLLEERELMHEGANTPILVAANKVDLEPHLSEDEIIKELNLDYIQDNPWVVIPISALHQTNIDKVISWLVHQSK